MPKKLLAWIFITAIIAITLFISGLVAWSNRHDLARSLERANLPSPIAYQASPSSQPTLSPAISPRPADAPTPKPPSTAEANLAVPFTVQAPHANWEPPYKEFCEEASILMAISFVRGESIASPAVADQKMLAIKAFEEARFGYYEDTTIAEVATVFKEHYNYDQIKIVENPTVEIIKQAVAAGKPVIVPAAGRELGNPYFQTPGPLYHMVVIKGYTAEAKFITNDPGTRRGADFLYPESVLMNAIHDWRPDGQINLGRKAILIVG